MADDQDLGDAYSTSKIALIMVGLCLAVFLTGMDQTILSTATPAISNEFHSLDDIGWWTASYLLMLSTFQLFYGKLYSLFSIKKVYLVAIVIFEIGSLVSTTAPNTVALIFGRSISGLGAAGIFSGGVLITTKIIVLQKRAAWIGIMSASFGAAAIIGPFIGGALTDRSTWRWCFGINLPLGAVTLILCIWLVSIPRNEVDPTLSFLKKVKMFDFPGTVLLIIGLVCLLIALQWGGSMYPWSNGRVIALLTLAGALLIGFVLSQSIGRKSHTIPKSIYRSRSMWFAAGFDFCVAGGVYVAIVYLPVWFQAVKGADALHSGIMLTPLIAAYVVCSILAGILTSGVGYYIPSMSISVILMSIGAGLLTTLSPATDSSYWIGSLVLYGSGVGFGFGQPTYVAQTLLPEEDIPIGVTFITLVQNLSASIFVAVAQAVFENSLSRRVGYFIPNRSSSIYSGAGAGEIVSQILQTDRPQFLGAYSEALINTIYISLALSCLSLVGVLGTRWVSMKRKPVQASDEKATIETSNSQGAKEG